MTKLTRFLLSASVLSLFFLTGCHNRTSSDAPVRPGPVAEADSGFILIAKDINYDVIVNPPAEADPWETERMSGYNGNIMIEDLFQKLYAEKLQAYDMLTGESITPADVRKLVNEMNSSGTGVAKLQFTEDWYYNPATSEIKKIVKSIILGYEFRDSQGTLFGHRALFKLILAE